MNQRDAPEAPIYFNHAEASAWQSGWEAGYASIPQSVIERAAQPHPSVKSEILVNGGALKMALNVLRRAGKNEVADELEMTATIPQPVIAPALLSDREIVEIAHRTATVYAHTERIRYAFTTGDLMNFAKAINKGNA